MSKKALLIICDGWGIGDKGKDDVIFNTPTPYWDELLKTYPASQLQASGENVGLPSCYQKRNNKKQARLFSVYSNCFLKAYIIGSYTNLNFKFSKLHQLASYLLL